MAAKWSMGHWKQQLCGSFLIMWVEYVICAFWWEVSGTQRWPEGGAIGHHLAQSCQIVYILLHITVSLWLLRPPFTQNSVPSIRKCELQSPKAQLWSGSVTSSHISVASLRRGGEYSQRNYRKQLRLWTRHGSLDSSPQCSSTKLPSHSVYLTLHAKWGLQLQ